MAEQQPEPIDWQKAGQQLNAGLSEFTKQMTTFMAELGKAIRPVFDATLEMAQHIHDALHQAYVDDGAIYGDTHEGLMRWMHERSEIERLRAQAERIEQHQDSVRSFKRTLAEKRDKSVSSTS